MTKRRISSWIWTQRSTHRQLSYKLIKTKRSERFTHSEKTKRARNDCMTVRSRTSVRSTAFYPTLNEDDHWLLETCNTMRASNTMIRQVAMKSSSFLKEQRPHEWRSQNKVKGWATMVQCTWPSPASLEGHKMVAPSTTLQCLWAKTRSSKTSCSKSRRGLSLLQMRSSLYEVKSWEQGQGQRRSSALPRKRCWVSVINL